MGATRRTEGRLQRKERSVEIKRSLSYPKGTNLRRSDGPGKRRNRLVWKAM